MIELLYGLPGDGKSYSATKLILEVLAKQKCFICHNVPLVGIGKIAEYFEGERFQPDIAGRLRLLSDGEVGRFWRCLGPGFDVDGGTGEGGVGLAGSKIVELGNGRKLTVPNYDKVPQDFPGVVYVLDEAHIHFSAYKWAEISEEAMWAVSQHRHLGMEVVLVSQHPEKIAKSLRRDIHRYTRIKNFGNRRTLGFIAKGKFRRVTYPDLPTKGGETMIEEASWFTFNPKIAALYNTNAGVGIISKSFSVERQVKGLPLKSLFLIVPLILCLTIGVPYYGSKLLNRGLVHFAAGGSQAVHNYVGAMVGASNTVAGQGAVVVGRSLPLPALSRPVVEPWEIQAALSSSRALSNAAVSMPVRDELYVKAYAFYAPAPDACSWTLSDGRIFNRETDGFQGGGRGWLIVKGKKYGYRAESDGQQSDRERRGAAGRGAANSGGFGFLPGVF